MTITVTTISASLEHGPVRVYWGIGTVASVLLTGIIAYTKERNAIVASNDAIQLRTTLATTLNDMTKPIVGALGKVAISNTPTAARAALDVLTERTVSLAVTVIGSDAGCKKRAAFYIFDGNRLKRENYAAWTGANAPRQEWVLGRSPHDDEVIKFARGEDALLVVDLENYPPPHFADNKGRDYKSFVSVPVRTEGTSFGLLTADADRAYALTDVDRGFLILIAGALAAGMAHVEAVKRRDIQPESGNQAGLEG